MRKVPIFHFLRPSLIWGFLLGSITSIPYFFLLWPYGPFGILLNIVIGIALGVVNGIFFAILLNRSFSTNNYRLIFFFTLLFTTFILSTIAYFTSFIPYGGATFGMFIMATIPSVINAIIAGYISQRVAIRYRSGKSKL